MLKQSSSRMKKVLAILLTVLFVASVTSVAASARYGGYGRWGGYGWGWGGYPHWGYGTGCVWVNGNWTCPSYVGMPYTIQASVPAAPAPAAPDPGPNVAGLAIFPEPKSTSTNSSSH